MNVARHNILPLWVAVLACVASVAQAVDPSVRQSASSGRLDAELEELHYEEVETQLTSIPAGAEHDYFAGVLANRENRLTDSITLLQRALPAIRQTSPARSAIALQSLGDDYVKSYRYREAISAYEELLGRFREQLSKSEIQSTEDDYHIFKLLQDAPPQTISIAGPVHIRTHRSPIGSIDAALTVNGITTSWILDTGANFSTVSASFAERLGLAVSKEAAQTQGITGAENPLRVAILPELRIGTATVHNVVLIVLEDRNLNVEIGEGRHYKIDAVLGYPVLQALGTITFTADGEFETGAVVAHNAGARLFMKQLTPLLQCGVNGRKLLFSFDTGANASVFSARYYREFPSAFISLKPKPHQMAGAGGLKRDKVYSLPEVRLAVGPSSVVLHNVAVLPAALGADLDATYGNLGRDVTAGFRSFTLDFANMRFVLGDPLRASKGAKN